MRKYIIYFILISFSSCTGVNIFNYNLSYLYNPGEITSIPDYVVYNSSDSVSTVYFMINKKQLLYVKNESKQDFEANIAFKAELYESYSMKTLYDSCYVTYNYDSEIDVNDIWGSFRIKARFPGTYLLKITFYDINRRTKVESFEQIFKSKHFTSQDFLIINVDSIPIFSRSLKKEQPFLLLFSDTKVNKLQIKYYNKSFPVAYPPYVIEKQTSVHLNQDSIFDLHLSRGYSSIMSFQQAGLYFVQVDTSLQQGCSLFCFDQSYPYITSSSQLLYPLRYVTSNREFDDLISSKNTKDAIDKFWLEVSGNTERAKEMIKLYYNRVQEANKLFTSYLEGWKTDRGMIYIIYGQPNAVYRSDTYESWIYGEDRNMLSINFTFNKVPNPFTENDYNLNRSILYKDGWYMAVYNWRR